MEIVDERPNKVMPIGELGIGKGFLLEKDGFDGAVYVVIMPKVDTDAYHDVVRLGVGASTKIERLLFNTPIIPVEIKISLVG